MIIKINTLEKFANWVWNNNFTSMLASMLDSHFEQWTPTVPIEQAYENALEDLWSETLLKEFPEFEFSKKIKKDVIRWCAENLDHNGISIG